MANYLRVRADARNGRCWLFLIGDLDLITADRLADCAGALLDAVPGPVVVDLSGLTFIDARGARTLAAMIQALSAPRRPVIHGCPPHVRFVLDMLGLSLGYRQADYRPAERTNAARSATHDLVVLLRAARLHATSMPPRRDLRQRGCWPG